MSAWEVLDEDGIRQELRWLYEHPDIEIAVDTETTGFRVGGDSHAVGASLAAVADGHVSSLYIPLRHNAGWNAPESVVAQLRYVLATQPRRLVFANCQFDILSLESVGIPTEHQDFTDIIVLAHLLDENTPIAKSLAALSKHYLGEDEKKIDDKRVKEEMSKGFPTLTYEELWAYAVTDAELTWRVKQELVKHKEYATLPEGLWEHKQRLVRTLLQMRRRGVKIDTTLASAMVAQAEEEIRQVKFVMGLKESDPIGPKVLTSMIHEHLGIPILHKTPKGAPKFDKVAMAEYDELLEENNSDLGKELKRFRGWQKASSAAYKPYLELMDSDGRLRCGYKLHGTTTGRLSCAEPNLQQIPKESDKPWNGRVKECFIAEEGYTLINADYSQLELRLATAYAQEPLLVQTFAEGKDIFTEMTKDLQNTLKNAMWTRQDTKTLVYSMQYGAGINRLMQAFHVTKEQAEKIRAAYYRSFPRFRALSDQATRKAESDMTTTMWSGRKRRYKFKSETFKAMNSLIQGGAADIVERVMVRCFEEIDSEECKMLLQVHDSITWEIRTDLVDFYVPRIRAVMEDVDTIIGSETGVRFAVDITPWSAVEAEKWGKK